MNVHGKNGGDDGAAAGAEAGAEASAMDSVKGASKRDAILDAALSLFAQRGFFGTAMPLVAEKAGVAAGTIYRYFESKEQLVNALLDVWLTRLRDEVFQGFDPEAPPRQQFHFLWQQHAHFAMKYPQAFEFLCLHHHEGYMDEHNRQSDAYLLEMAHQFFDRAKSLMLVRDMGAEEMIAMIEGMFSGLFKRSRQGRFQLNQQLIDEAEAAAWEAMRRPG